MTESIFDKREHEYTGDTTKVFNVYKGTVDYIKEAVDKLWPDVKLWTGTNVRGKDTRKSYLMDFAIRNLFMHLGSSNLTKSVANCVDACEDKTVMSFGLTLSQRSLVAYTRMKNAWKISDRVLIEAAISYFAVCYHKGTLTAEEALKVQNIMGTEPMYTLAQKQRDKINLKQRYHESRVYLEQRTDAAMDAKFEELGIRLDKVDSGIAAIDGNVQALSAQVLQVQAGLDSILTILTPPTAEATRVVQRFSNLVGETQRVVADSEGIRHADIVVRAEDNAARVERLRGVKVTRSPRV